jgi:hypothetical protein
MSRKCAHRWAAPWVLAMLCLRALIPAGFMLVPVEGQVAIVLCETNAARLASQPVGHDHASHHHTEVDRSCPYAQSSGPAPLPTLPILGPQRVALAALSPIEIAQTHLQPGPHRQQSSRGPPRLA